jgi:repressor LexA
MKEELTTRQREVLDTIIQYRDDRGYPPTVRELARILGVSSPRGATKHLEVLERKGWIRRTPGVSRGIEVMQPPLPSPADKSSSTDLPILGTVPAGPLDLAVEDMEGVLAVDTTVGKKGDFLLRVRGESMIGDHIKPGDLALIRPQVTAQNGDLVVALVDDEATMKRYRRTKNTVVLEPSNPSYTPIEITKDKRDMRIIGKVKAVIRLMDT